MYKQEDILFDDLARLYLQREILISKLCNAEVDLTRAEDKVRDLIEDAYLLRLVGMLDDIFALTYRDPVLLVRQYRGRLNKFVSKTIGFEEYGKLLPLKTEELERRLKDSNKKLQDRKNEFPILEGQLSILLRWFRKGVWKIG